jgi:hypothetical protein
MSITRRALECVWVERGRVPLSTPIFCILRPPLERVISSFWQTRKSLIRWGCGPGDQYIRIVPKDIKDRLISDNVEEAFELYLEEIEKGWIDGHDLPQMYFLEATGPFLNVEGKPKRIQYVRHLSDVDHFIPLSELADRMRELTNGKAHLDRRLHTTNAKFKRSLRGPVEEHRDRILRIYAEDDKLYKDKCIGENDA